MTKPVWIALLCSLSFAARADAASPAREGTPPEVKLRLRSPAPTPALAATAPAQTCPAPSLAAAGWGDPSDGFVFASHPTARLDAQELYATALSSLAQLRFSAGTLHLFVLGMPAQKGLSLGFDGGRPGWRPRWPFC